MRIFFLAFTLMISGMCAQAQAQSLQANFNRWNVYTTEESGETICYIASPPIKENGSFKKRGQPFLMVTDRGVKADEISFSPGYAFKAGVMPSLHVVRATDDFSIDGEVASTQDFEISARLIEQMKQKNEAFINAISAKGTTSRDVYSLGGFSAAYDEMKRRCELD